MLISYLKDEILKEENVVRITRFRSTIDNRTRNYSCDFTVKLVGISTETQYRIITTQNGFALFNSKMINTLQHLNYLLIKHLN